MPDLDAKFYAATQTMDEARYAETYSRFLQEKVGLLYPINPHLKALLDDTLADSRWDLPYLGMQVLIEGLALAAFGVLRDLTPVPLLFSRIVPCVRDVGLWGDRMRQAFADMGVLDLAGVDVADLMRRDEEAARAAEVAAVIGFADDARPA